MPAAARLGHPPNGFGAALAGNATAQFRFLATSFYGNDIYIDNIVLLTD